jgi:hypothetical protein
MSSIKLLSELTAWSNFNLKEETPDRIVFELWDEAHWNNIAKGINRGKLVGILTTIILLIGASIILLFVVPKPWGMIGFIVSIVLITLFASYRVSLFQKTKFANTPCAIFNRDAGLATGIDIDFSTFESIPWQAQIEQIDALALKMDDPRFDMAMLEALDSNGVPFFTVFGKSNDLRKNAYILKNWLEVNLQDEMKI